MTTLAMLNQVGGWPAEPYKGLSYYGLADAPLLAGRDDDVWQCARLLAHPATRALVIHGLTGCGKSSFVRAGLIPVLEDPEAGFHFLKQSPDVGSALFIRCTARPMERLAATLAGFLTAGMELQTPIGTKTLDLRKALPPNTDVADMAALLTEPEMLSDVLGRLSGMMPQTLTLVLDQAEEVLTLDPSAEGQAARDAFFRFVSIFTRASYDMKLVFALRTEYYGRFFAKARAALADVVGVREYFLDELTREQIEQAILRPTMDIPDHPLGSPRETYRFTFEPSLPARIIDDLSGSVVAGGILPVLQLVCSTLYERTRPKTGPADQCWTITTADYEALGGPEGQVEEHLEKMLVECMRGSGVSARFTFVEADRWKSVLERLVRVQADGSVTTDIVTAAELAARARDQHCQLAPAPALAFLARDEVRILREVFVLDRVTGTNVLCYSLGHDTLGLVLRRWKIAQDEIRESNRKTSRTMTKMGAVIVTLGLAGLAASAVFEWRGWWLGVVVAFYGAMFALAGRMPDSLTRPSVTMEAMLRLSLQFNVWMSPVSAARILANPRNRQIWRLYPDLRDRVAARLNKAQF